MRIGAAAARSGVTADTLRYYERQGLLPKAPRTDGGYRQYTSAAIERIRFVRNALRFGFSVRQVAAFVRARESGRPPCADVRASASRLLDEMETRLRELTIAREQLRETLADWDRRLASTPPGSAARLLEHLSTADDDRDVGRRRKGAVVRRRAEHVRARRGEPRTD